MLSEEKMEGISHNVIIDGRINFVQNSVVRKCFVTSAKIKSEPSWT